jgi:ABC-2 type transport system ATP-binding protein
VVRREGRPPGGPGAVRTDRRCHHAREQPLKDDPVIIRARGLSRFFIKTLKKEGLGAGLKSLFHRETLRIDAVRGLDLEVRRGEILGVIGPNGAGKTTLVKMLSGIIRPTGGDLSVLGFTPRGRREEFLSRISVVMGQKSQLWPDLPARDSFLLNRSIYRIPENRYRATIERLTHALAAGGLLEQQVRTLSLGQRMKVEFMAAMLHEPDLIFLDEPTIGLDALAQKSIREFLREENAARGTTILLTSHYLEDIRRLCPRTIVINRGRKTWDGPTEAMFASVRERSVVTVSFATEPGAPPDLPDGAEMLESAPFLVKFVVRREEVRAALASLLASCDVADVSVEEEELADSAEKIYRREASP